MESAGGKSGADSNTMVLSELLKSCECLNVRLMLDTNNEA